MEQVIEMCCFGGLTNREIAECIGVDERSVGRDWQVGRSWLVSQLKRGLDDADFVHFVLPAKDNRVGIVVVEVQMDAIQQFLFAGDADAAQHAAPLC